MLDFIARRIAGDPVVLSRMLSGLITGYQVMDPEVMGDDAGTRATFTVEQLQELVARAFVIDG